MVCAVVCAVVCVEGGVVGLVGVPPLEQAMAGISASMSAAHTMASRASILFSNRTRIISTPLPLLAATTKLAEKRRRQSLQQLSNSCNPLRA